MNCVPDFVKVICILGVYGGSLLLLQGIKGLDEEIASSDKRRLMRCWFVFSTYVSIATFGRNTGAGYIELISLFFLSVYLVVCTTMDLLLCQVNDFMQYLGLLGAVLWVCEKSPSPATGYSIVVFALLQYGIFMRMYGKADGMAFSICALYFAGMNGEIEVYLFHMLLCFLLLAVVQLCKRNVSLKGKLKRSVALYPYITAVFFFCFHSHI